MRNVKYTGGMGRIRFLWKYRCAKVKILIEVIGLLGMLAFGLVLNALTIWQWFIPGHGILLRWNFFGEALPEFIIALIVFPCILYTFKVNADRLAKRLWGRD